MSESRRRFFANAALLSASLAFARQNWAAQFPPTPPPPPQPAQIPNPAEVQANAGGAAARRARLLQNEKEFRKGVEHLYELASELRDELQKTVTTDVLSIRMVKKAEEIEKLAKSLKNKARDV